MEEKASLQKTIDILHSQLQELRQGKKGTLGPAAVGEFILVDLLKKVCEKNTRVLRSTISRQNNIAKVSGRQ